jgi:hypothetical protein
MGQNTKRGSPDNRLVTGFGRVKNALKATGGRRGIESPEWVFWKSKPTGAERGMGRSINGGKKNDVIAVH